MIELRVIKSSGPYMPPKGNSRLLAVWFAKTQYNRIGSVPAGLEASNIGNLQYSE
jgi:hypothetical protein